MTKKYRFKVDKLIRDKLPGILQLSGINVFARVMTQEEYLKYLKKKIIEEAQEVASTLSDESLLEELADVLEVIYALATAKGLPMGEIEAYRQRKKADKGGFANRFYSPVMEIPEGHPKLSDYRSRPFEYPEVKEK